MTFTVDPSHLRREMARRGLCASELAQLARLSTPTIGAALSGRAISASSLRLIAQALAQSPLLPAIDALISVDSASAGRDLA